MTLKVTKFILTASLFFCSLALHAQWVEKNNGLYGGTIYSLVTDGSNLFAGTSASGVFVSTDNGTSWTAVNSGLTSTIVKALAVSGGNLFAGTSNNGVFLSTSNGTSWTAVNSGLTFPVINALTVSGPNLFVGTGGGGAFLTTNNGTSWTAVNSGLTNQDILSLAMSGTNLFAGTNGGGVFLSTNNGTSWTEVNSGLTNTTVLSLTANGSNLFAGTSGGVFVSTNNGTSWTPVNSGLSDTVVRALTVGGPNLFAGTNGGVFLSTDNGASWLPVSSGLTNTFTLSLTISGSNLFVGTSGAGVFLSSNNGTSWSAVNSGLTNTSITSFTTDGSNLFAGAGGGGIFRSTNNGTSWTYANTGLTNPYVRSLIVSGSNLFAGTNGGVFRSTNNGTSWTAANSGLTNTSVRSFAISGSNLFAGTDGGVFLSIDDGNSWTAINSGLSNINVRSLTMSGSNLYAGTNGGGVFLSTDNGDSWTAVNSGLTNSNIRSLIVSGTNLFAGTAGGVFLSTNNGTSWTAVSSGLNTDVRSLTVSGSNLFAGTSGGIFLSTNIGTSWTAVNSGLPSTLSPVLSVSGTNLFVGNTPSIFNSAGGVWARPLSELVPPPTITSIAPAFGPIGTSVTIAGNNFDPTPANNIVYFGATRATVNSATSTQLMVTVPVGATYQPITVQVNGLMTASPTPFKVTYPGSVVIDASSFAPKVDLAGGTNSLTTAIGDLDEDGKPDIALANYSGNVVSVYRNISTTGSIDAGSFAAKVDFPTGSNPQTVAIADLDGDGKPELIVPNQFSNTVSVFKNISTAGSINGSSFATKVDFATGANPYYAAIGDLDADGKPDLVVANYNSASVSVFKNTASFGTLTTGSFAAKVDFTTGSSPSSCDIRDIDGDGKPDIAVANYGGSSISVLRNVSTTGTLNVGSFSTKVDFAAGSGSFQVAIGDMDNDNLPDLVVANQLSNTVSILRNTSTSGSIVPGSFATKVDFTVGSQPYNVAVGDLNGDGRLDLAVANSGTSTISILRNTSSVGSITSGSFSNASNFTTGATPRFTSIGDLDSDGKPELVTANFGSSTISILRNNIAPINVVDSLALVALYNATNGSGWTNKTNWLTGPVNTWHGVVLSGSRVTAINLAYNKLAGTLPVELGALSNLVTLNLSGNQLTGGVPTEFNNLDALTQLYLGDNNLTDLPLLTGMLSLTGFFANTNLFTFEDIVPNVSIPGFNYCCQRQIPSGGAIPIAVGSSLNLSATIGGSGNVYQWKKYGASISGAITNSFSVATSTISDAGTYNLEVTNPSAPSLTLRTTDYVVQIKSLIASDDSGYTFWKKLGAEALGIAQIKNFGRVEIDNLGNYYLGGTQIQKVDPSGNLLFTLSTGNSDGGLDIVIDSQNSLYTSGNNYFTLKKFNSSGNLVFETPSYGGGRPFQTIAIDVDGSILAMDYSGTSSVRRFDSSTGNFIGQISLTGGPVGSYNSVFDFDVDATGNIYVPDQNRIDKFSPAGAFISSINASVGGWGALILQVADNGHLYVAPWLLGNTIYHFDTSGSLINSFSVEYANGLSSLSIIASNEILVGSSVSISRFDLNGNFLGYAEPRDANGQFSYASDIAIDSKGFRYVVDRYNNRIQKLTANGNWVGNIGSLGSGAGQFNRPGSIAIDKSDNLYVTDDNNNRVQKFNSSGTHLLTIGSAGAGNGQFTNPVAIVVSKTGDILVADKGNSRVQIFKSDGTFVSAFGAAGTGTGQFTNLRALAVEADGTILAVDGQARLQRFTSQGTFISELNMVGPVTSLPNVATDLDGFLYIPTGGVVKKFDKNGGHITDIGLPSTSNLADGELRSVSVSSNLVGDTLWIADDISTNRISIFTANFRKATASDSLALVDLYNSTNGAAWTTKTNWLTGAVNTWYGVKMSGGKIRQLSLPTNLLDGPLPASLATLDNLLSLKLNGNKISGTLTDWNVGSPLQVINLSGNKLTQIGNLKATNLSLDSLAVQNNNLTFEDLEPNISIPSFTYSPQDSTGLAENVLKQLTEPVSFTNAVAGTSVQYQWKRNNVVIPTATTNTYTLPSVQFADDATYRLEATSTLVPGLVVTSRNKILRVSSIKRDSIALRALYDSTAGSGWTNKSNWLSTSLSAGNWFGVTVSNNRVTQVNLPGNNLIGKVPPQFTNLKEVTSVNLSSNKISSLSNLSSLPLITTLRVENNQLDFGDLEANVSIPGITYSPQDSVSTFQSVLRQLGENQTFTSAIGGTANSYQWKKNGVNIPITTTDLLLSNISFADDAIYSFESTSSIVTGLTLSSAKKILRVSSLERDEKALTKLFNDTDGPNWIRKDNWISTPLATGNWFGVTIANNRVTQVNLPQNNLKGPVTAIVADIQNLVSLNLSDNKITSLPDLTSYPSISTLNVSKNNLDFASLEKNAGISVINYANQADLGKPLDTLVQVGSPIKFKLLTGGTTNSYQWIRNGQPVSTATDSTFTLSAIARNNMGDYICEVTNSAVPGLKLKSTLQRAKAVANISGQLQINSTTPVAKGKMILLKINPVGIRYDTTQTKNLNVDGTFNLEKVVLDDYILLGQADTIDYRDYFPTYYNGSVFWEEADTIRLNENRTDLTYAVATLPTEVPKGVGELRGTFENEIEGGRVEGRGRVSGASVTVRRQQNAGRPSRKMAEDEIVAFLYTNDEGRFVFENLEEGFYLLNIQFPGVPMDTKTDVITTIGPASRKQNIQEVTALATGGKIVVTRKVIVGVSEEEQASIQIYPNPVTTDLYVNLIEGSGDGEMKMFDSTGKEILSQQLKEGKSTFDLSALSSGIYILKIYRGDKEVSAARVVVQ